MPSRHERRQQKLGRAPLVVAMPSFNTEARFRSKHDRLKKNVALMEVDYGGKPGDSKFVAQMYEEQIARNPSFVMLDPTAPLLIARHKLTSKAHGMCAIKPLLGGKIYAEAMLVEQSREGRMAARALLEYLMTLATKKVCMVEAGNEAMKRILEHYGARMVAFVFEGPYTESAAAPSEEKVAHG